MYLYDATGTLLKCKLEIGNTDNQWTALLLPIPCTFLTRFKASIAHCWNDGICLIPLDHSTSHPAELREKKEALMAFLRNVSSSYSRGWRINKTETFSQRENLCLASDKRKDQGQIDLFYLDKKIVDYENALLGALPEKLMNTLH
jgi:hypothetical protein